jgi:hypothetical protein
MGSIDRPAMNLIAGITTYGVKRLKRRICATADEVSHGRPFCSIARDVFRFRLRAGALEINTPRVNVPAPHINVPKPHINVPTVNLRLSNHVNTVTSVRTPSVGSSNAQGALGFKVVTPNTAGGSATPTQAQQQNAAAAPLAQQQQQNAVAATLAQQQQQEAAGVAIGIAGATSGAGSPGGENISGITWDPHRSSPLNADQPVASVNLNDLVPTYGTAAYYNYLKGGGENAAYAADMSSLQGSARSDFNAYMNYLLYLLGLTQDTADTGMSWTAQETALIEAAMTACVNSPSTCAATVANLNAELASLGVPAQFNTAFGSFFVLCTPSFILSFSFFQGTIAPPDNTLSFAVVYWQQAAADLP